MSGSGLQPSRWALTATLFSVVTFAPAAALGDTDGELWLEAGVDGRVHDRLELELDQGLRLDDNMTRLDSVLTQAGLTVKPARMFRIEAGYRFIYERAGGGPFETGHRFFGGIRFDAKKSPARMDVRLRYQEEMRLSGQNEHEHTVRTRFRLRLDASERARPYVSGEVFVRLADPDGASVHKGRLLTGLDVELDDVHRVFVELGYEKFARASKHRFIVATGYGASFD